MDTPYPNSNPNDTVWRSRLLRDGSDPRQRPIICRRRKASGWVTSGTAFIQSWPG